MKFSLTYLLLTASLISAQNTHQHKLESSTQLIVVTSTNWNSVPAQLQRFERKKSNAKWHTVGSPFQVNLGKNGMAWGRGLTQIPPTRDAADPLKVEGDGKSPAGIFSLSSAFGYAAKPQADAKMPYIPLTASTECVDDPRSLFYNRVLDRSTVSADWQSSEKMLRNDDDYRLGLIIDHNANPITQNGGSCIFMHIWEGPGVGTTGCTAMPREQIEAVLTWLNPKANPLLVQLPTVQYQKLKKLWKLPELPAPPKQPKQQKKHHLPLL